MDRFWDKVDKADECWLWTASIGSSGYGQFNLDGRLAHVVSYEEEYGEVPEGYELHHTCENKPCVRPDHLKALTRSQHMIEHKGGTQTMFPCGHYRTEENSTKQHSCRICGVVKSREWKEAHREEVNAYQRKRRAKKKLERVDADQNE